MAKITREFAHILSDRLSEGAPLIQAIVGPRQVGKTTGVQSIYESWPGAKISESADTLQPLSSEWLALHFQRARDLGDGTLLVLDEIQKVPNWSEALKKLYDESRSSKLKVVILGSASFKLQRGLSDSLAGRYELLPAPHWGYSEMKSAFGLSIEEYLTFGGYPGAAPLRENFSRWRDYVLNSIVENVLSKDLSTLADIRNPALLRQLFFLAMEYPAQEVSFQKLIGQLQDKGAIATVKHYLEVLESAHLLKLVYKYTGTSLATRTSSPKLLPLAPALVSAVTHSHQDLMNPAWRGRVFEMAIGAALAQIADALYYWRDGGDEVDFVVKRGKEVIGVEVKSGRPGKKSGLMRFKERFPKANISVITWEAGKKLLSLEAIKELQSNPLGLLEI